MRDFAAIDFETANECPSSVCSVGIVVEESYGLVVFYTGFQFFTELIGSAL